MEKHKQEPNLKKQLNPVSVWAIAFGCIIGWGAFINPGKKFLPNSGVYGTAIAMLLGAAVMVVIAFSYAYMVPKYPKAGGDFMFARICFGEKAAYLCGWFLVVSYLSIMPMNATAIGLIVDGLDGELNLLKFGFHYQIAGFDVWMGEMLLAIGVLVLFALFNLLGVRMTGAIQTVLAATLTACTLVLAIAALISAKANGIHMQPVWGFDKAAATAAGASGSEIQNFAHTGTSGILSAILATFAITPWAYSGFGTIPQEVEEFRFPHRKVMGIMMLAILFGCMVYISNNTVAAAALENWPDRVIAGDWVLLIAAEELLGTFGKVLLGIGVSCAVLCGIMGFYLASSRLILSMSRDGFLPKTLGVIDAKRGTPKNAILFCLLISLSGPILGREALGWFVDMSSIGASIGYLFTCLSTLKTMKQYRDGTMALTCLAWAGVIASISFVCLQVLPIPGLTGVHFGTESYLLLAAWIVLGAVFYLLQHKKFQKN